MWKPRPQSSKKSGKSKPPPSQERPPQKSAGKGSSGAEELDDKDTVRGKLIANEVLARGQRKGKRVKRPPFVGTGTTTSA